MNGGASVTRALALSVCLSVCCCCCSHALPACRWVVCATAAGDLQQLLRLPWSGVLRLKRDGLVVPVPVVEVSCAVLDCVLCCIAVPAAGSSVHKLHTNTTHDLPGGD
jgi:hypothetical protein